MNELIYSSAVDIADAIRAKRISAVEATEACLSRISLVNPILNAVVAQRTEDALVDARRVDEAVAAGSEVGPLAGVPMTIKDSFETEGLTTTAGTGGLANHVPQTDATVVARLERAGAILLGKTNVPEITLSCYRQRPLRPHQQPLRP